MAMMRYIWQPTMDPNEMILHIDRELPSTPHVCRNCAVFDTVAEDEQEHLMGIASMRGIVSIKCGRYALVVMKGAIFAWDEIQPGLLAAVIAMVCPGARAVPMSKAGGHVEITEVSSPPDPNPVAAESPPP